MDKNEQDILRIEDKLEAKVDKIDSKIDHIIDVITDIRLNCKKQNCNDNK